MPRFSDGKPLSGDNVTISGGTTPTTIHGSNNDQLIEAGSGNDTVVGGSGIDMLFGGTGNDVLVGGPNNDYLYGGTGYDTLSAGAGTNFLQSGSGPTTFLLSTQDSAQNSLNGFRPGTDQIDVTRASGTLLGTAALGAILSRATTDASGNAVLALSATNSLTLNGVLLSELGLGIFGTTPPSGIPPPEAAGTGTDSVDPIGETTTLTTAGNNVIGAAIAMAIHDTAGGNTVAGGTGGLNLTQTVGTILVSTSSGATDNLDLVGSDTVSAAGIDTISASGSASVRAGGGTMQFVGGAGTSTVSGGPATPRSQEAAAISTSPEAATAC